MQPDLGRSRQDESESVANDRLQRTDAQGPDGQALDCRGPEGMLEGPGANLGCAPRHEQAQALPLEASQCERDRGRRRRVHPLVVVDRHEQRSIARQQGQQRDDRDAERPRVDLGAGIVSHEEGRLEGPPPGGGEGREVLGPHVAEKVAEHHVGQEPLAFGGP